jgi:DNA helicase-2/ATP-dependent DNA helicase PcrA
VAVPGLSGGTFSVFPSYRPSPQWPWRSERLPRAVRGDRDDLPAWTDPTSKGIEAFKAECRRRDRQEERRLAYVAVTRAREALFCTGYWWGATAATANVPASPFLEEVEAACQEGAGTALPRAPEPGPADTNPLLAGDRRRDVPWPVPPAVSPGVAEAAVAVRRAVEDLPGLDPAACDESEAVAAPGLSARTAERLSAPTGDRLSAPTGNQLSDEDQGRLAEWRRDAELLLRERSAHGSPAEVVLPAGLSVSDVVLLDAAPADLARRLHRPLPQPPAPAARRGTAFHAWLERRSSRRSLLGPDDLPGAEDQARSVAPGDLAASEVDELAVLQQAFLSSSWATREPIAVEVPFELVIGSHLVRGRIDAVYPRPDGGQDVVDYKTGSRPRGRAAEAVALQLACYRLAWAELNGLPESQVGAAFLYVREGDAGEVRPSLPDRAALEQLLSAFPEAQT